VYNGKDFLPADYESKMFEKRIRQQIGFRKYDPEAVVFIDGGFRETVTTEFFLVPENGEIPTPTETVDKPVIPTDKTFLFDKTHVYFNNEYDIYGGINEEDEFLLPSVKARLEAERIAREEEWAREKNLEEPNEIDSNEAAYEQTENPEEISEDYKPTAEEIEEAKYSWAKENFGEMIEKQKDSRGVIVFYADDQYYDVSKLQARFEEGKQLIAKKSGISPNKMEIIFGGYRDNIQLEFWIVPKKGKNPTPSPQERKIEDENTFFNQP
ncbi:MAG TPA: hypothetical protein PKY59_20750, partial [Pyrinomonadaceae bacterium]|nr:hypothetical protein [Pyrinomonadaceae bacterium]